MRVILVALLGLCPLSAQIKVLFSPVSLIASEATYGPATEAGAWNVLIVDDRKDPTQPALLSRERILMMAPQIRVLTEEQANKLLEKRTKRSKWAIAGRVAQVAVGVGGVVAGFQGSNSLIHAAAGLNGGIALIQILGASAANSAPRYVNSFPLEPVLVLPPGGSATRTIMASRMANAQPIAAEITIK